MDSKRWEQVQALFQEAADQPASQRLSFLKTASGGDEALIAEVQALLEEDARGSPLDYDIAQIASRMFGPCASPVPPFQEIGPYRIREMLGEGGMGVVYLAEREDLGSLVAIKLLRDAWMSPARRERFAMEQRTLAQFTHPSIARLYDADTLPDGTPWFAMEYIQGVPLTEYCRRHGSSIEERLKLFGSVCEAVRYAHSRAVIHRDLKPSNILVQSDGCIKLLDFGIAKHLDHRDSDSNQTRTGLGLMTPAYAAPEQIRGEQAGTYSDVYSLGVILYDLLTGRLPFDLSNVSAADAAKIIAEHELIKPSAAVRRAPRSATDPNVSSLSKAAWSDLDVLCLTALHSDTHRRYRSVEALIRDVDCYLKNQPLEARPDTLRYRLRKFVSRNQGAVVAASSAFALLTLLVVFFTVRLAAERDNANRQTAIAVAVNGFLSDDLLGRGNPFQSGKAAETLLDAVNQASPNIDRKFAREPQVAARLHLTIAHALDNRSNFPEARAEYGRAYKLFLQTGGPLSEDAIAIQLQRAVMEARTFQSGGIPAAKSLVAAQESLLRQIDGPRKDLAVWLYTAKGMIALIESDAKSANRYFRNASDAAAPLPEFDDIARFNMRQRVAFTYIRLGDGATAERLIRELIAAYSHTNGPDNPYVLRVRLNLAQAFMIQRKYREAVHEANAVYPDFLAKFGPDHELTMQLLSTRAQCEGSLEMFDESVRDDLAVYAISVKKQGPLSFFSIATLTDASIAQCRAHLLAQGELNARKAYDASSKAFGPHAALTDATALSVANCLIDLGKLQDASKLLEGIHAKAVAQLTGDPDWGAGVTLAQAEIALRDGRYAQAQKYIDSVRPVFSRPDAEAYQKRKMDKMAELINSRR